jgi:ribosome-associated protein
VEALGDKKAERIKVLDVGALVSYADFLVIASGRSTTHVQALVDAVEKKVQGKWKISYVNRSPDHSWWIVDFVDLVVHVFNHETRTLYDLEGLWMDAPDGWETAGLKDISPSGEND